MIIHVHILEGMNLHSQLVVGFGYNKGSSYQNHPAPGRAIVRAVAPELFVVRPLSNHQSFAISRHAAASTWRDHPTDRKWFF